MAHNNFCKDSAYLRDLCKNLLDFIETKKARAEIMMVLIKYRRLEQNSLKMQIELVKSRKFRSKANDFKQIIW